MINKIYLHSEIHQLDTLNFTDEFENSEYCYLTNNYRSNQEIVTLSNAIIYNNQNKIEKDIICGSKYDVIKPQVRFFPNDQKEKDYILNYIIYHYHYLYFIFNIIMIS